MSLPQGALFGACNPLLDISANVKPELLEKYKLKANAAILADDTHLELYKDLERDYAKEIEYIPGGSGQNALRCASWILNQPNVATFVGCVGKDETANIMSEKSKEVGLNSVYQVDEKTPTGKCAVLITGNERSLVAYLAAANNFTEAHFDDAANWSLVEKAQVFYVTGFFFSVSPPSIMKLAQHAFENKRTFSINLSAPFICQFFKDPLMAAMPFVDILFGNEDEAQTFSEHCLGTKSTDIKAIAKAIAAMPKKGDTKRIVIITQGSDPVIFVKSDEELKEFPIKPIEKSKIIDTNGAGDAFVGGFLSQFIQGKDIAKCIDCGTWVSGLVIQRSGCTFPDTMDYQ